MYYRPIDKVELLAYNSPVEYDCASSLTSLLDDYLGTDNCRSLEAMRLYKVGALHNRNGAKFWRLDENSNPKNGQILLFDEQGNPDRYEPITRCLYSYYNCQYILSEAFFGGHLLGDITKPIAIVEDEISALLGSQLEQRFTWLAIGHGQNLTHSLLAQLMGYQVTLFPDDMAAEYWQRMAQDFPNVICSPIFTEININSYFRQMALPHGNHAKHTDTQ